nr:hypothetical protein CFP56_53624 [Quercus suber]
MVGVTSIVAGILAMASTMYQASAQWTGLDYKISFARYRSDSKFGPHSHLVCDTKPMGTDLLEAPHCKSWKRAPAFDHFAYSWKPHDPYGEGNFETGTASKYGNCTIKVFQYHDCEGPTVAEIHGANDPKVEAKCETVKGGEAHSIQISCFGGSTH